MVYINDIYSYLWLNRIQSLFLSLTDVFHGKFIVQRSILVLSLLLANTAIAEQSTAADSTDSAQLSKVFITGGVDQAKKQPGSAVIIDDVALEQFEYSDIHRVLNQVPGVNIQEEDGYGLRPNIGIRGTAAERSKKVTIMEDGVLSGPAPYSAPAAYYFPNVSRMSGVEVFKGPATIQYGPATVAGAINLVSRPVPALLSGGLDVQYGQDNFQKYQAYVGDQVDVGYGSAGWQIEGLRLSSDGFKQLDNDKNANTGFVRNDVNVKTQWQKFGDVSHLVQLKLGYADEESNETYLGLTKQDLSDDNTRRYAASELDKMDWTHKSVGLTYVLELSDQTSITTDVYHRQFERDWFKFNRLGSSTVLVADVLKTPSSATQNFYDVITGAKDSASIDEQLLLGNNGREYISQGVQTRFNHSTEFAGISNDIEVGLRFHQDQVERLHTEQAYEMRSGHLQTAASSNLAITTKNKSEAKALAIYLRDQVTVGNTTITAGVRSEQIETEEENLLTSDKSKGTENVILPGAGFYTQLSESFGVLAGVHKGFIATSPGQNGDIQPEESTNFELGMRVSGDSDLELIGFYNDYSNLKGTCSFNKACTNATIDKEANGGQASVYGAELSLQTGGYVGGYLVPINLTYTYTKSQFETDFTDNSGVFGDANANVLSGYEMAYVPQHKLNYQLSFGNDTWQSAFSLTYQSEMRDTPGKGKISSKDKISGYTVIDWAFDYAINDQLKLYSTLDNVFDRQYAVALQPMGYRPGKPRRINVGAKYEF